ncbi:MAG: 3-isopropylmalate dehydratase small subunit [Sulfolobales archaeon]
MKVEGKVIKLGDKIDTDIIIPAKYLKYTDPQYLAQHVLEPLDPEFSKKAAEGIILVAGKLFGTGSSREQAAIALKAAGVKAVLAESFSRIFYRNAINNGLPVLVCQGISGVVNDGDYVVVNLESSEVLIQGRDVGVKCKELPDIVLRILSAGGLIEYLRGLKK